MSYSYMTCVDNDKNCKYNKIDFDKYFNYFKSLDNVDNDTKLDKLNEFVCNDKKGKLKECCNPNDTEVINDKYIKKVENGYQVCKCKNEKCKKLYCKDFTRPSKYQLCKIKSDKNKKINDYVIEINNENLMDDCFFDCN